MCASASVWGGCVVFCFAHKFAHKFTGQFLVHDVPVPLYEAGQIVGVVRVELLHGHLHEAGRKIRTVIHVDVCECVVCAASTSTTAAAKSKFNTVISHLHFFALFWSSKRNKIEMMICRGLSLDVFFLQCLYVEYTRSARVRVAVAIDTSDVGWMSCEPRVDALRQVAIFKFGGANDSKNPTLYDYSTHSRLYYVHYAHKDTDENANTRTPGKKRVCVCVCVHKSLSDRPHAIIMNITRVFFVCVCLCGTDIWYSRLPPTSTMCDTRASIPIRERKK